MNRIIIILAISLLNQIAFGQIKLSEFENLESLNLKGKVKTIKETSFKANKINSEVVKLGKGWQYDWQNDKEYFFDTLGNLISRKDLINSKKSEKYSIKLDNENRIIEIHRLSKSIYFEYDTLNRILSSKEIIKQPETTSNGNTKPTSGVTTNYSYYYDSKNLLLKREAYKSNLKISVETFKYDNFNNLILWEIREDSYIETHKYEYDSNNLLIKYEWADNEDGIAEITTIQYLNNSKVLEHWVDYEEGEPDGYIDDKFENGNIVESVEVEADGSIASREIIKYDYDASGNWIKSIIDFNGKYYIIERNIEYYE
ncbi:MAG: hypothetical protein FGM14_15330 [Flavobacteriales bacterium]|nr:hypothetical protein [Flavobacteriales bacterium]